jgi:GDP-L-fucose synthase
MVQFKLQILGEKMQKDSKIYIAGHKGLVGSAILRALEARGYSNFVLRTSSELDLTSQVAVNEFFTSEKPEHVFMAAAKVGGINANNIYRADFIYNNLEIQNNVVSAAHINDVKKLLFLGSSCIYPKNAPQPLVEDSLLTSELEYTNEPYALAKIAGIKLIESYNIQYGTNYLAVMPTNLYGVNDNFDLEKSHVMPALIRKMVLCEMLEQGNFADAAKNLGVELESEQQILDIVSKYGITKDREGVSLAVWGSGKPFREFLHVNDMADACVHVMENVNFSDLIKDMTEIKNTHINVGTGKDLTIAELAHMIKEIVGFKGKIKFDASKPDGTPKKLLSVEKLEALGWKYKIELRDGLSSTIEWYKEKS